MAYRPTKNPPITEETTLNNARQWLNIVRFGESGSVVQIQDDCEYRVADIIDNSNLLKKFLGPYYRKYLLKYVSFKYDNSLEETVKNSLIELIHERKLPFLRDFESSSINTLLDFIAGEGFEVGLFIGRVSPLLSESNFSSLINLELILQKSKNLSTILFFERDVTNPNFNFLTDKCSLIFDNIIKYPLYSETDCKQFFKYQTELWKMKIKKSLEEQINKISGGYLWIIASLLRYFRDHPQATLPEALKDDLLNKKIDIIWNKLSETEKNLVKKSIGSNLRHEDKLTPEYLYLEKIRIFNFPLLKLAIDRENKINQLKFENGKIYLNDQIISTTLTYSEKNILEKLLKNQGKTLSRAEIACAIWGNSSENNYSDWALDRLAFRLRKKLTILGIDPSLFKTLKKKGFQYG